MACAGHRDGYHLHRRALRDGRRIARCHGMPSHGTLLVRDKFNLICRTIWGDEWQRHAAAHLKKSRRTIIYWSNGTHEPEDWKPIFLSLVDAGNRALAHMQKRQQSIIEFKRAYGAGR